MVVSSLITYATAKAYSMKGKLFTKKDYSFFAESRNLEELVTRLKETQYSDAVSHVEKPLTSASIESSLRSHQAELHYMLIKAVGGSEILHAYYLRFILRNIKAILKDKVREIPQEHTEKFVNLRAEELIHRRDLTVKALIAKNTDEVVAVLKPLRFGNDIEKAVSMYYEKKILSIFDVYFDKIYFENLAHVLKSSSDPNILHLFGMELDYYNILGILRGKFWALAEQDLQDLVVPHTSSTSTEFLSRLIGSESIKSTLNEITTHSLYGSLISEEQSDIDSINAFERSFELLIYRSLLEDFSKMFSFSIIVAIARLLDFEVRNLTSISFSVGQNLKAEMAMKKLVLQED